MSRTRKKSSIKPRIKGRKTAKVYGSSNSGYGNNSNSQDYYAIKTRSISKAMTNEPEMYQGQVRRELEKEIKDKIKELEKIIKDGSNVKCQHPKLTNGDRHGPKFYQTFLKELRKDEKQFGFIVTGLSSFLVNKTDRPHYIVNNLLKNPYLKLKNGKNLVAVQKARCILDKMIHKSFTIRKNHNIITKDNYKKFVKHYSNKGNLHNKINIICNSRTRMGKRISILGKATNKFLTDSDINHLCELLNAEKMGNNVDELLKQQDEDLLQDIKNMNEGLKKEMEYNRHLLESREAKKREIQSADF